MYGTQWCPFCAMTKRLLQSKGWAWKEFDVEAEPPRRRQMIERSGRHTVPQIFIGARHVGGFDDLMALETSGELDRLMMGECDE